ncbi:MAG: peptidyl-prolyl cis-trans isomerase [Candidatus Delongbacteria bacterium]|nr:peptidyl-prolyl cis-trans isomerase [bacterium]MBL7033745.1 peptidyl-prolyl cis-trans isomerase [Candidatus Delongbacteria bacterium]
MVSMVTNYGTIMIELDYARAPITCANFEQYVNDGFFDGTIFHRVISNFMIQGGGFAPDGQQKETLEPIANEAGNGLLNNRGTVAMARTSIINSATAQFFINVTDNAFLNHRDDTVQGYGYAVFGHVVEGMDVVDAIRVVKTGTGPMNMRDWPAEPVIIETVTFKE